jgi:CubicO group peptidase (beta-lactamase class C family)
MAASTWFGYLLLSLTISADPYTPLIEASQKSWNVPGVAVVIVHQGKTIHLKGYGVRELNQPDLITEQTLFPLGSCTKAFTSLLISQLADEGKLGWDVPVREFLPDFQLIDPVATERTTFRDLMSHRTGVDSHDLMWFHSSRSLKELVSSLRYLPMSRPFRQEMHYQTLGVVAAGMALEKAGLSSWEKLLQSQILDPLEMKRSGSQTAQALKDKDHAIGYRAGKNKALEAVPWYHHAEPNPSGSMYSSAVDLGTWMKFQLGDGTWKGARIISELSLREMQTPQLVQRLTDRARMQYPKSNFTLYGLGWVVQDYRGEVTVAHTGISDGFRAQIAMLPEKGFGVAVMSNLHGTRMNLSLINQLIDQFLKVEPFGWDDYYQNLEKVNREDNQIRIRQLERTKKKESPPRFPLSAYAGTYEDPAYGTAEIIFDKGTLNLKWNGHVGTLEPYQNEMFILRSEEPLGVGLVGFILDPKGVASVHLVEREFFRKR